jgi:hypothetical protein
VFPDIRVKVNEEGDVNFENQGKEEQVNYATFSYSLDQGKTWSNPAPIGINVGGGPFIQILDDSNNWEKQGIVMELTLIKGFNVEKRRCTITGPQKGVLTRKGYVRD